MKRTLIAVAALVVILTGILLLRRNGEIPRGSSTPAETTGAVVAPAQTAAGATTSAPETTPTPMPPPGGVGSAAPNASTSVRSSPADPWRKLTRFDFAALPIADMPPDDGNVSPIASDDQRPEGDTAELLATVEKELVTWSPGRVADPVQRVRNFLLLLGAVDIAQSPVESYLPAVVVRRLLVDIPAADLPQLTCWIALHPDEGDASVLADPLVARLRATHVDPDEVRHRTHFYGVKLTRRLIGW